MCCVQYLITGDCGIFPGVSDSYLWSYSSTGCCIYTLWLGPVRPVAENCNVKHLVLLNADDENNYIAEALV